MGFGDRFRKVMGIPVNPDPVALRRSAFNAALEAGDEIASLENALAFSQAQMFEDALGAFRRMEERFAERRAEWLRWQGQTLYIGLAWRAKADADRVACYRRALDCYFQAAELGDRSQEFNVVELCEALFDEASVPEDEKRAVQARYLEFFPEGEGHGRVERLGR